MRYQVMAAIAVLALAGCDNDGGNTVAGTPGPTPTPSSSPISLPTSTPQPLPTATATAVTTAAVASFDNPWAMVFLPDGRLLVTEKPGRLQLVT